VGGRINPVIWRLLAHCLFLVLVLTGATWSSAEDTQATSLTFVAESKVNEQEFPKDLEERRLSFRDLGWNRPLELRGGRDSATISFGSRSDELVVGLRLKLDMTYSPSLLPGLSHLKVFLNDEVVAVLPLPKEQGGQPHSHNLDLDPRFLTDFNRIRIQLIGHYTEDCEDPLHSSIWADIGLTSELDLKIQRLNVIDNLKTFPEPFFYRTDQTKLVLPLVFADIPSTGVIRAAGTLASWFGLIADWRGARFPVLFNELPQANAIVFALSDHVPDYLRPLLDESPLDGPTLAILSHPNDSYQLLAILGRDDQELQQAVNALILGKAALAGRRVTVIEANLDLPRQPYDAPRWVKLDRPMRFGELVERNKMLEVKGHQPDSIRINLRVPADLFLWRSKGIPVNLKYNYSPTTPTQKSRLTIGINDEFIKGYNLALSENGSSSTMLKMPLESGDFFDQINRFNIPAFRIGSTNQLQFQFSFDFTRDKYCGDILTDNLFAALDPDSEIDFSGFPHYTLMPNLAFFANSGYPFTVLADLAETTAILPDTPSPTDLEVLFSLLGRMGASTGYPATRLQVAFASAIDKVPPSNLLLIGSIPQQPLLQRWADRLPSLIEATRGYVGQPAHSLEFWYQTLSLGKAPQPDLAARVGFQDTGPIAAMIGFESPLQKGHSVVAVTATTSSSMTQLLDALDNSSLVSQMRGSVVFARGGAVESTLVGETYYVGELGILDFIWFHLSNSALLLAAISVLVSVLFAIALWRTLRAIAARRLRDQEEPN
jgi:hypothetical protein